MKRDLDVDCMLYVKGTLLKKHISDRIISINKEELEKYLEEEEESKKKMEKRIKEQKENTEREMLKLYKSVVELSGALHSTDLSEKCYCQNSDTCNEFDTKLTVTGTNYTEDEIPILKYKIVFGQQVSKTEDIVRFLDATILEDSYELLNKEIYNELTEEQKDTLNKLNSDLLATTLLRYEEIYLIERYISQKLKTEI
jgi:hypothetical protein